MLIKRLSVLTSPPVIWSLIALAVVYAYLPGLTGPFVFDDQLNIVENPRVAIRDLSPDSLRTAFFSNESGPLKRPLPALSFGINHYFAGGFHHSLGFKATNIAIHCLNSLLVFWLIHLIWPWLRTPGRNAPSVTIQSPLPVGQIRRERIWSRPARPKGSGQDCPETEGQGEGFKTRGAERLPPSQSSATPFAGFVTLIWALSPLQLTSVLYVVQRMNSMAAFFLLLGLCVYMTGRMQLAARKGRSLAIMASGLAGGTLLGLACKENAILLPAYAAVLEFSLLYRSADSKTARIIRRFYAVFLLIPLLAGMAYLITHPGFVLGGYGSRPFSLVERMLTEPRVLWFYLYLLFVPDIRNMGLFHDDFPLSTGLLEPRTTMLALVAWGTVLTAALWRRKSAPVLTFAVLWYLVGHGVESTIIALEIIHEHRNYLPSLGPLLGAAFYLTAALRKYAAKPVLVAVSGTIIIGLFMAAQSRAYSWQTENGLIESLARNQPFSPASQYLMGEVLQKKLDQPEAAYGYYKKAADLAPKEAGFHISLSMAGGRPKEFSGAPASKAGNAHIVNLLVNEPVSAWTMRALDVAVRCVMSKFPPCQSHLDDVALWLEAALTNSGVGEMYKLYFVLRLFDVQMKQGNFTEALDVAQQGKKLQQESPRFDLMRAHAMIMLRRLDEAEHLLDQIGMNLSMHNEKYLKRLTELRNVIGDLRKKDRS